MKRAQLMFPAARHWPTKHAPGWGAFEKYLVSQGLGATPEAASIRFDNVLRCVEDPYGRYFVWQEGLGENAVSIRFDNPYEVAGEIAKLEVIDAAFAEWPSICRLIVKMIHEYCRQIAKMMIDEAERAGRQ
jgi:hypothetical protein